MRICHLPIEIAGQLALSVDGLRSIGQTAVGMAEPHRFRYPIDRRITLPTLDWRGEFVFGARVAELLLRRFDVFHYHFGRALHERYLDPQLFKALGASVVVEFWGSDIRSPRTEHAKNPFFPADLFPSSREKKVKRTIEKWSKLTNGIVVVSDHTFNEILEPYFQTIYIVGQRVPLDNYQVGESSEKRRPRVVHAPSRRAIKGTDKILKGIEELRIEGVEFDFFLMENASNEEVKKQCQDADIIIDQIILGSHGVFALECMAMGKTVITYIREEFENGYPHELPVVNANPHTFKNKLAMCVSNRKFCQEMSLRARRYVEKIHDHRKVGRRLLKIYENTKTGGHPTGIVDLRRWH